MAATWLPNLKLDRMFVLGEKPPTIGSFVNEPNVLRFPVSDLFCDIAPKVRAALEWGLKNKFGPFFICDDDTYVIPERLEGVPDEVPFDYLGWFRPDGGIGYPLPYIQGSAYWLSQQAAELAVASPEMARNGIPDDVAMGRALFGAVEFTHDSRFHPGPVSQLEPYRITTHKCLPLGTPTMYTIHAEYLSGRYAQDIQPDHQSQ